MYNWLLQLNADVQTAVGLASPASARPRYGELSMKSTRRNLLLAAIVLLLTSLFAGVGPVRADGGFVLLSFPESTAKDCGTGFQVDGSVGTSPGSILSYVLTDAYGTKILVGQSTMTNGGNTIRF